MFYFKNICFLKSFDFPKVATSKPIANSNGTAIIGSSGTQFTPLNAKICPPSPTVQASYELSCTIDIFQAAANDVIIAFPSSTSPIHN